MDTNDFIKELARYVQKYAPRYGIKVCSPIIAQAVLESDKGRSELAVNACNYFGLKYREGRCPTSNGIYIKEGAEQNADGSYSNSVMKWCKFADMENGVIGYFDFINIANYSNLKGVTDPKTYLENIKADGYATSLKYVSNLMKVIESYDLTQYDEIEESVNMVRIAIDAGHGLLTPGKRITLTKLDPNSTREWSLNDRIADKLEALLKSYNCEVLRTDDTTGKEDVSLDTRVKKANDWKADVFISIHHNAGIYGGSGGGTIVYYYSDKPERKDQAKALYDHIVNNTGLIGNRSAKVDKNGFYVIKKTNAPAFLIENGFMDSVTDVPVILKEDHATKTARGILDFLVDYFKLELSGQVVKPKEPTTDKKLYRVQVGAFSKKANAERLQKELESKGYNAIIV